jgi:ribosomal protein L37AE/L43A
MAVRTRESSSSLPMLRRKCPTCKKAMRIVEQGGSKFWECNPCKYINGGPSIFQTIL